MGLICLNQPSDAIIIQLPSVVILGDHLQGTFCAGQFVGNNLGEIALVEVVYISLDDMSQLPF